VHKRLWALAAALLATGTVAFAACGDDDDSGSAATTAAAGSTAAATTAAAASTTAAPATSAASATTAAAATTAEGASLAAADNATIGQEILVDSAGMTVYLFVPDGTATTSAVPDGLKAAWPAVVAEGEPVAGPGLDAALLTVAAQPDGAQQLAYNGHLLYTFANDAAPGDANGQGLGEVWYVLSPAGEQIG
jgi:predicted lipoprotein with Yx(FWY)xxD motif